MSEFTLQNWRDALSKVFALAAIDHNYRTLCLTNPHRAVERVSNIQLPHDFRFEFVDKPENILSSLLLPPLLAPLPEEGRKETIKDINKLTEWYVAGFPYVGPMEVRTVGPGGTHTGSGTTGSGGVSGGGSSSGGKS